MDGFIADKASRVLDTTLFIPDFNSSDNGVYVCAAINSNGFTLSDIVNVTIGKIRNLIITFILFICDR